MKFRKGDILENNKEHQCIVYISLASSCHSVVFCAYFHESHFFFPKNNKIANNENKDDFFIHKYSLYQ